MRKALNLKGQSLFEVVVSVGIFAVITAAIVGLATSSIRNSTFTKNNSLATRYTQEAVEWLRNERDTDWVSFQTNADTLPRIYCLKSLSWGILGPCSAGDEIDETILLREVEFSLVTDTSVTATVTTAWTDSQGTHQAEVSTVYTDWRSR